MSTWPIIQTKRTSAYVSYADTLQKGDVVQCKCCQIKFPELTKEELQLEHWGDAKECVHCRSYICDLCYERGWNDIPGAADRDFNKSEHRAYISFAWCYMQFLTEIYHEDGLWGDWNFCSKSCRARHHWFRAACKVNIMTKVYLNSDPYRTYKRNIQKMRLATNLLSKREHPMWNFLNENFDTLLKPHLIEPQRPTLPGPPRYPVPNV